MRQACFVTLVCDHCAKPFRRKAWRVEEDGFVYFCGRECYTSRRSCASPEAFWRNVVTTESGCMEWRGKPLKTGGYGRLRVNGKTVKAHRHAWVLKNGPIPEGKFVCHDCDNPICVNPEHLFLGTAFDNMQDMAWKGRSAGSRRIGEAHPMAKLTAEQVREIRRRYVKRGRYGNGPELAREYGVTSLTLWAIATGRSRQEVPAAIDGDITK